MEFIKMLTLIKSLTVWKEVFIFLLFLLLSGCNHKESEKIIFVGDSLVRNWDTEMCLPFIESENLGVDGYRMKNCRNININDSEATVVILVETNDLTLSDKIGYEDDFADDTKGYDLLSSKLSEVL